MKLVPAAVVGAIVWNLITWPLGLRTSSSPALIGGVAGAAISAGRLDVGKWHGLSRKCCSRRSPRARSASSSTRRSSSRRSGSTSRSLRPGFVNSLFRRLQIVTAGFAGFAHGVRSRWSPLIGASSSTCRSGCRRLSTLPAAVFAARSVGLAGLPRWGIATALLAVGVLLLVLKTA